MENLYLLTTKTLGDFYVVSSDPTSAELLLYDTLSSYGSDIDRQVINISLLTNGISSFGNELKPALFFKTNRLVLSGIWEKERLKKLILKFTIWQFNLPGEFSINESLVNDFFNELEKGNIK